MTKALPHVFVVDVFGRGPDKRHQLAYKLCIDAGIIQILLVRADPVTHYTVIKYLSTVPEDWIHDTLRETANGDLDRYLLTADNVQQMMIGDVF